MAAERCPCCDSELTAWMNAWHETHGRKCGTCGLNFTDDHLARFRATADARVAEAVKPWREALEKTDARLRSFCTHAKPLCQDCVDDGALPCELLDANRALLGGA